jgi:hypothetical protein
MNPKEMIFRTGEFKGYRLAKLPHGRKDNVLPTFSNFRGDFEPTPVPRFKVRFKNYKTKDARWNSSQAGNKTYQDERGTSRLLVKV